jgi:hypothetical protein
MSTGNANIDSNPQGARLCIDGKLLLDSTGIRVYTPVLITDIPVGQHRFAFHYPGHYRECVNVDIIENQTVDIFVTQVPK